MSDLTALKYVEFQLRLIQEFNTDDSIWTVLQLMRFPGSINTKDPVNQKQTKILSQMDKVYFCAELDQALPKITEENQKKLTNHFSRMYSDESADLILDPTEVPERFKKIMEEDPELRDLFQNPDLTWGGDRSKADLSLCNRLYILNFDRDLAFQVIFNTEKSRSRQGNSRYQYAKNIIDKVYDTKTKKSKIARSINELEDSGSLYDLGAPIKGPEFFDCLGSPWRQRQVLGLVGGTGIGKTSVSLKIIKDCITNNANEDYVYLYFSLEMSAGEIVKRWNRLTNNMQLYKDKLYVVTNEAEDSSIQHLGLQEIFEYTIGTVKKLGKKVGAVVIDHVDAISPVIDLKKPNSFGFVSANPWQTKINIELKDICAKLKELAKDLNCFMIIQSQTTKAKSGDGDSALGVDAAFGSARFEWFCDFVMTCWQPLMSVYAETPLRLLAWKYAKIREVSEDDLVQRNTIQLLHYNLLTGDLRALNPEEYYKALDLIQMVAERKHAQADKKQVYVQKHNNSPIISKLKLILNNEQNRNNSGNSE